ncbi:hypothetical protein V7O67_11320 [Methanolobus sp. ZRKC4]
MTDMSMNSVILLYGMSVGLLGIFSGYLIGFAIDPDDDLYKILCAFAFSFAPSVVGYSTWTIPTRGLLIVFGPLFFYMLVKSLISKKYIFLTLVICLFLFVTHHLFYFLLPPLLGYALLRILNLYSKYKGAVFIDERFHAVIYLFGFILMFSIPFVTGKFVEQSRYMFFDVHYIRYIGVPIIFVFGGIVSLIFKPNKKFTEKFLLLSLVLLTFFIFQLTYMKMFAPVIAIPFAILGLNNAYKTIPKKKYSAILLAFFLISSTIFVGYFQFLHEYSFSRRQMDENTYITGTWMKNYCNGSAISNDDLLGMRLFTVSEHVHFLVMSSVIDHIYGFIGSNVSEFKRFPLTSDNFWLNGYEGPDPGNYLWADLNRMQKNPIDYNISYVAENDRAYGQIVWSHSPRASDLIAYSENNADNIYSSGEISIWYL